MKYCYRCGNEMEDGDIWCSKCGKRAQPRHQRPVRKTIPAKTEKEPLNKLMCELAYVGTLFWLPLLVCPKERYARYYANQGLWILILSVVSCTAVRMLGSVNRYLSSGIAGILSNGVYALVFLVFLCFMLFLLWSAFMRAMDIHNGKEPKPLLFFEQITIIRHKEA